MKNNEVLQYMYIIYYQITAVVMLEYSQMKNNVHSTLCILATLKRHTANTPKYSLETMRVVVPEISPWLTEAVIMICAFKNEQIRRQILHAKYVPGCHWIFPR